MSDVKLPTEKLSAGLLDYRQATASMPWFTEVSRYHPRGDNVVHPLINGERAFAAVNVALQGAKKSIDIISWGFDPSMRLVRPAGPRVGELLRQKAREGVQVRVLIWKNALANFKENNIIGDGVLGSGGGSAGAGSGAGSTAAGDAAGSRDGPNGYGANSRGSGSAGVLTGDPEAKAFNREWFAGQPKGLSFRTRDFGLVDRKLIEFRHIAKHGLAGPVHTFLLAGFPSHHQKTILVDYEVPDDAVGFVMGHNMLRDYWDADNHEYYSELRLGFKPWQDLSSRVYGQVLWDINDNFCTAWTKAQPWFGSDQPIPASRTALQPEVFAAPARKRGAGEAAQICRTQPPENERSILDVYKVALSNARRYVYFENQYFRNEEIAKHIIKKRRELKSGGWPRDFYVFVITNVPDSAGRLRTHEMMAALGKGQQMPAIDKKADEPDAQERALRKSDLQGLNVVVCTLCSSGMYYEQPKPIYTGGTGPYGFPAVSIAPPVARVGYQEIYVHSKLMLIDDIFFTLGSANINIRSMETDTELNIAMPSPKITREWREHLWRIHTKKAPSDDMALEFGEWSRISKTGLQDKKDGNLLKAPLIEFFDDGTARVRID